VVSDTYTVLVSGKQTAGRYALLDMFVPPQGGPPPHRHDFEEMFYVLDGEVVVTFRDQRARVTAGMTVNIPARAPHHFTNESDREARLLCMVSPPGSTSTSKRLASRCRAAPHPRSGSATTSCSAGSTTRPRSRSVRYREPAAHVVTHPPHTGQTPGTGRPEEGYPMKVLAVGASGASAGMVVPELVRRRCRGARPGPGAGQGRR